MANHIWVVEMRTYSSESWLCYDAELNREEFAHLKVGTLRQAYPGYEFRVRKYIPEPEK